MRAKVFSETLVFIYQDTWRHITGVRIIFYGKHNSSQQDPALSQTNPVNAISSLTASLQPENLNLCNQRCGGEKNCRAYCAHILIIISLLSFPRVLFLQWNKEANTYIYSYHFSGAFAKLRKATISFVMSVRLCVRPHNNAAPTGRSMFRKSVENIQV
jgi:hypothetical protein